MFVEHIFIKIHFFIILSYTFIYFYNVVFFFYIKCTNLKNVIIDYDNNVSSENLF